MAHKLFAERLNRELDDMGVPEERHERIEAFSRLTKISPSKADHFLNGLYLPDTQTLSRIASELGVKEEWLVGK